MSPQVSWARGGHGECGCGFHESRFHGGSVRVGGYGGYGYGCTYSYGNGYGSPGYYATSAVVSSNVLPNAPATGGTILIDYPAGSGPAMNFSLNGMPYRIQPGETHHLVNDRHGIVEIDRGSGFGTAHYSLTDGRFKIKATDHGWGLMRANPHVTADLPPAPGL